MSLTRGWKLAASIVAALGVSSGMALAQGASPVKGGTLIYLEQQPHTNLYPPAGGFYPNGGVLNQITDKLTWQNPKTLEVEPWIAESWTVNADATEYTWSLGPAATDRMWRLMLRRGLLRGATADDRALTNHRR